MLVLFDGDQGLRDTLRFIEEKLSLGTFLWSVNTGRLRWSNGMYTLMGLVNDGADPTPSLFQQMVHPEDRHIFVSFDHAMATGGSLDRQFRIIRRNGRVRWIASHSEVVLDSEGKPERLIGLAIDITVQHDAETQAAMSEQRRLALTEAIGGIMFSSRPDGSITDVPDWYNHRKENPADLYGSGWLDWVHPDDRDATRETWLEAVRTKALYTCDFRTRNVDGTYRWTRARAAPVYARNGEVVEWIGVSLNIEDTMPSVDGPDDLMRLTGAQIRAARGLLGWSVRDLSDKAGVTTAVLRRLEAFDGDLEPLSGNPARIKKALEAAGLEFLTFPHGRPSVRLR